MNRTENGDITWQELAQHENSEYLLIDVRDELAFSYGHIPGAVHMGNILEDGREQLPKDKLLVIYCKIGSISKEIAYTLTAEGYPACNLAGGYQAWLMQHFEKAMAADTADSTPKEEVKEKPEKTEDVERSLQKKFRKNIWCRFTKAVREYELVKEGDKIAVCISGGKDSMLMAKLFQELKRHRQVSFEVVFLVMDPGYSEMNRQVIENNLKLLGIPAEIFDTEIFDAVYTIEKSPCYLCARMRRGYLYKRAQGLGCNKIALGHHYDDVIETILMGMLYGAQVQTMMPKLHSTNFEGMELIRPMYLIREEDIIHWRDYNDLYFIQCACRFTDTCTSCNTQGDSRTGSKRQEIKRLISQLKKVNPFVESNIFRSVENVNLNTIIAYKQGNTEHHFLENYDQIRDGE